MYNVSVFISHSWSYCGHYETLTEWIFQDSWQVDGVPVKFWNTSVPKDNPIHHAPNELALKDAIFERIKRSNVVVVPTGMYATHSKWIQKELVGARENGKNILAVNPWSQERKSSIVQSFATETVGWNKNSIIGGIWRLWA